jgi:hypothetical protein
VRQAGFLNTNYPSSKEANPSRYYLTGSCGYWGFPRLPVISLLGVLIGWRIVPTLLHMRYHKSLGRDRGYHGCTLFMDVKLFALCMSRQAPIASISTPSCSYSTEKSSAGPYRCHTFATKARQSKKFEFHLHPLYCTMHRHTSLSRLYRPPRIHQYTRLSHSAVTPPPSGKPLRVLALESSADDACASVVTSDRQILSNVVCKQHDINAKYGGIHPIKAQDAHARDMVCPSSFLDSHPM